VILGFFSLPPPHLEPEMEMTQVEFFLSGLFFLITGWMEHILGQTQSYSVQNSGRDPQTLRTHGRTHRRTETTVAIHRFIHE
jgi:hypothetical protein